MAKRKGGRGRIKVLSSAFLLNLSYALFLLGALSIVILDTSGFNATKQIRSTVNELMVPVLKVVHSPIEFATTIITGVRDLATLREENARLTQENRQLELWQDMALRLSVENSSLKKLLTYQPEHVTKMKTARVLSHMGGPFVKTALIDAGKNQDLSPEYVATTDKGVVGRVTWAGNRTARLLLLTDMNSKIPVYVGKERHAAVLAGDNSRAPNLKYIFDTEVIAPGDRVVTSGHGGVFPAELPIGVVEKVDMKSVTVRLFADFDRLDYVRLLKPHAAE